MWDTVITVIAGPIVLAMIGGISWLFKSMERRHREEVAEHKAEKRILQAKVDQMLAEAIAEQRALVSAYQKQADANRQVSAVVTTNTKVIEGLARNEPT